jgi:hypothetical protein
MSLTKGDREANDEETPLLSSQEDLLPGPARTPLPIAQISILLTAWFAECVTAQSILPYINQVLYVPLIVLPIRVDQALPVGGSASGCRW